MDINFLKSMSHFNLDKPKIKLEQDVDLDLIIEPGVYELHRRAQHGSQGLPTGFISGYACILIVQRMYLGQARQILFPCSRAASYNHLFYERTCMNIETPKDYQNGWGDWDRYVAAGQLKDEIFPAGSIYISTDSTNPKSIFGVGSLAPVQDSFLSGASKTYYVWERTL